MREDGTTEFKREFTADGIRKTVIAFANTDGGTLWIGVDDEGRASGLRRPDEVALQIGNLVRDSIRPDLSLFVQCVNGRLDGKTVLRVDVQRGTERPYYAKKSGPRPEGVFVRQGAASVPASETRIRDLLRESAPDGYESGLSLRQDLTFRSLSDAFRARKVAFGPAQLVTLGLKRPDGLFTNLAQLLSDQCRPSIKLAAFRGTEREEFRDRREPEGSLVAQLEQAMEFLEKWNDVRSNVRRLERVDSWDYDTEDVREALLNAVVHRDYSRPDATLANVYSDRLEIVSPGGIVPGYDPADILDGGMSVLRNRGLAGVFARLRYIEAYGTGIRKIRRSYADRDPGPEFTFLPHAFRVVLPNRNATRGALAPTGAPNPIGKKAATTPRRDAIIALARRKRPLRREDIQAELGVSLGTAIRDLRTLLDAGDLVKRGNGRNTEYLPAP